MSEDLDRRELLLGASGITLGSATMAGIYSATDRPVLYTFTEVDGFPGNRWEGLNLGVWRQDGDVLRRVVSNPGDRARATGFPYHYRNRNRGSTQRVMTVDYDPSDRLAIMWSRLLRANGTFEVALESKVVAVRPEPPQGGEAWAAYKAGHALIGIAFGGSTQFESHGASPDASPMLALLDDGTFGFMAHSGTSKGDPVRPLGADALIASAPLRAGEQIRLRLFARQEGNGFSAVGELERDGARVGRVSFAIMPEKPLGDMIGIASRGKVDFALTAFSASGAVQELTAPVNDCVVCYPLGDRLQRRPDGRWTVRFVGMFRTPGSRIEIRIAETPTPPQGWAKVGAAGAAATASNAFRHNTALIDVVLPASPADTTLYYTIWKDGRDVTSDPRIGSASTGSGTGLVGSVPSSGDYVGRLPRLTAPYRICGLSCHAINTAGKSALPEDGTGQSRQSIAGPFYIHDQPTVEAFRHLEDYDFQIMLWDDDIWYMELVHYPRNVPDAYKIVELSIAGPTSRWQMMRHWNVLNPGDHDFGMDDFKGPEQLLLRNREDLGQDPDYLRRNFGIAMHLTQGIEEPDLGGNPKRWRKWRMPNGDFALLVVDARLWRSSQYPSLWMKEGWGADELLYGRNDPTRSLLGEEQFAWLADQVRTEPAPLICVTGFNSLHTIYDQPGGGFETDNRVAADFAGWVSAGAERVLNLLTERDGITTIGGDVHVGVILQNRSNNLIECAFGPIGRFGSRALKPQFGREMNDHDGRPVRVAALYHMDYANPDLTPITGPLHWNFLEASFDPRPADGLIALRLRNLIDAPKAAPRGGGALDVAASATGRTEARLPTDVRLLPDADVLVLSQDGTPLRATRTLPDGRLRHGRLAVSPQPVLLVATTNNRSEVRRATLLPPT